MKKKEDFVTEIARRSGSLMNGVQQELAKLAPPNELTTRTFKALNETKLAMLIDRYGEEKVNNWLGSEMTRGG